MSMSIRDRYDVARSTPRDIDQHMEYLRDLSSQCDSVVEGGVRDVVSTWAFLMGCAGPVVSYDPVSCSRVIEAQLECAAAGARWTFIREDWLTVPVPECDLLFIDTYHTYAQLTRELKQLGPLACKYIVTHDTVLFGTRGEDGSEPGLWRAVEEFVAKGVWKVVDHRPFQNGLTTLGRIA